MASGPGVGTAVAVAGGNDAGATLAGKEAAPLDDGKGLGEPKRQPPSTIVERASASGPERRMHAA